MPPKKMKTITWSSVPEELLYEILLKLPVKSLCRLRMGFRKWGNRPQSSLTADYHGQIRYNHMKSRISQSVGGLSFVESVNSLEICNPSTRESVRFNLPPCPGDIHYCHKKNYLGFEFDPIEKKYKVLSSWIDMRKSIFKDECSSYVLTLGEEAWRSVESKYASVDCSLMWDLQEFQFDSAGICIDGVIYYLSRTPTRFIVVGFDVRLETFTSISVPDCISDKVPTFLMEYGGCVAAVYIGCRDEHDEDAYQVIVMGVLTDISKGKWKCEEYLVPNELFPLVLDDYLAGSTPNGELVFVSHYSSNLIKLDCYDIETECMKEIKVRGPKRTWSGLTTNRGAARVCRHSERLESLQGLSPTFYHYQRY